MITLKHKNKTGGIWGISRKRFIQCILVGLVGWCTYRNLTITLNIIENWSREIAEVVAASHMMINENPTEEDDDDHAYPSIPSKSSGCRIIITKKLEDFHYEIFESVALQYPLPWHNMTPNCDSESGLQQNKPIVVDYFLGFEYSWPQWNLPEGLGWKTYFENHLEGRRRRRRTRGGDKRWIQYGSIVDSTPEAIPNIPWKSYAAHIEINCDWFGTRAPNYLKKKDNLYCVFHGKHRSGLPPSILHKVCWLNPYHDPNCWFVPSIFPKLPPPPKPFMIPSKKGAPNQNKTIMNVCMSWKSVENGKLMRNPTVLVDALKSLKPTNLRVLVIGRYARVPRQFNDNGVAHYVTVESDKDFYEYQTLISKCHVIVPLLHPSEDPSGYFEGRLSGMVSLAIGRRIPTLLHSAAADIYKDELTAFNVVYDTETGSESFILAFSRMLDYYNYTQEF